MTQTILAICDEDLKVSGLISLGNRFQSWWPGQTGAVFTIAMGEQSASFKAELTVENLSGGSNLFETKRG